MTGVQTCALPILNRDTGRVGWSLMNTTTYTTESVWREPGPLYADVDRIRQAYTLEIAPLLCVMKQRRLCVRCARPACKCCACAVCGGWLATPPKCKHECWLRGFRGPLPIGGRPQSNAVKRDIRAPWSTYCVRGAPKCSCTLSDAKWTTAGAGAARTG